MPEVTVVYWRDIPAQVLAGRGRAGIKRLLHERFEQAIDRAAMRDGAIDTDSYLAEWGKSRLEAPGDTATEAVETLARTLETDYDTARLRALVDAAGWAGDPDAPKAV